MLHADELIGEVGVSRLVLLEPTSTPPRSPGPAGADAGREVLAHAVGDEKLRVLGPAVVSLGGLDLLFAERFTVGGVRVLLVR